MITIIFISVKINITIIIFFETLLFKVSIYSKKYNKTLLSADAIILGELRVWSSQRQPRTRLKQNRPKEDRQKNGQKERRSRDACQTIFNELDGHRQEERGRPRQRAWVVQNMEKAIDQTVTRHVKLIWRGLIDGFERVWRQIQSRWEWLRYLERNLSPKQNAWIEKVIAIRRIASSR